MLISPNKPMLYDYHDEGDKTVFTHVQNIEDVVESAQQIRKYSDNGFTESREFQMIARIAQADAIKHPEIFTDEKAMKLYLQGEGRKYCTCDPAGI